LGELNGFSSRKEKEALETEIAGVAFRFSGMGPDLLDMLRKTYCLFPRVKSLIDHSFEIRRSGLQLSDLPKEEMLASRDHSAGTRTFLAPYFKGSADEEFKEGVLQTIPALGPQYEERAVENYIRWVLANILYSTGRGLLLHASASVIDGAAHVFLGPHGSGKSTAAELTLKGTTIADDALPVIVSASGVFAAAMPAVGKFRQDKGRTGTFPVKASYWLVKSGENRAERIDKPESTALIMASAPFIAAPGGRGRGLFDTVAPIVSWVPFFRLYFRKEENFLDSVAGDV